MAIAPSDPIPRSEVSLPTKPGGDKAVSRRTSVDVPRAFIVSFALVAIAILGTAGSTRADDDGERKVAIRAIDSLVVGTTTEDEFLRAGWSFEAATRGRIGLLAVLWDDPVHSYFLGTCSGLALDTAMAADAELRSARESSNRPRSWEKRFCAAPHGELLRYVQFHDAKLFKIEGPPPTGGGDLDRLVVGVTTEDEFLKLGWSVEVARRFGLGVAGVAMEGSGERAVDTYFLDVGDTRYCNVLTPEEAQGADLMIRFMRSNRDQFEEPIEKIFCPGPRVRDRYVRFRAGRLIEIEVPGRSSSADTPTGQRGD